MYLIVIHMTKTKSSKMINRSITSSNEGQHNSCYNILEVRKVLDTLLVSDTNENACSIWTLPISGFGKVRYVS